MLANINVENVFARIGLTENSAYRQMVKQREMVFSSVKRNESAIA